MNLLMCSTALHFKYLIMPFRLILKGFKNGKKTGLFIFKEVAK